MITLYEHPLSPYAQKVKIALREKGLEFEAKLPAGIGSGGPSDAEFSSDNPRMEVPLLIDGESVLFDSSIILEYLEDRVPIPALLPRDPLARARARTVEEVVDTHFEAITWGLAEVRFFRRATGEAAAGLEAAAQEQLRALHRWLEERLGGEEWLNGQAFGWADLCAAPFVNGAVGFGYGPAEGCELAAWLTRANARHSVATTTAEAAAAIGAMTDVADVVASGAFKRQYRDHRLEWMIRSGGIQVVLDGLQNDSIRFTRFP